MFSKSSETTEPEMERCMNTQGPLPACGNLAVPYVPFQQTGAQKYTQSEALDNGTLFPGLNLPFHMKANARNVPNTPLSELQALEFVVLELGLYLDTHQDDTEAMELFRQYVALEKEGRKRYEAQYGPLTQMATAQSKTFNWVADPWPWNLPEGGKK